MQTTTCKRAACGLAVPPYHRAKPVNLPSKATDASRGRPPAFFETLARPSTLRACSLRIPRRGKVLVRVRVDLDSIPLYTSVGGFGVLTPTPPFSSSPRYLFVLCYLFPVLDSGSRAHHRLNSNALRTRSVLTTQ